MNKYLLIIYLLTSSQIVSASGVLPLNPEFNAIGGGFNSALGVRNAGDGSNRLFVIERNGTIRVIDPSDESSSTLFLSISGVDTFFEGGFQGLAFHPDYANNGYFFVYYTRDGSNGDPLTTVVERYQVSAGDPNVADPSSGEEIFTLSQPAGNHNGGDIHFGADGYLYIGLGDGGASSSTSQNSTNLLGKILRIEPSIDEIVTTPYTIPADNPFVGTSTSDEIWSIGFRNPYRWSFDRDTGDMLVADVGAGSREEVNLEPVSSPGGLNYGWNCREGMISGPGGCSGTFVDPILDYSHASGRCSITGGYRYRGIESSWFGSYLFGDFCTGEIFIATEETPGNWSFQVLSNRPGSLYGFGESETGRLFYSNGSNVYEISDADFSDVIFENGFE